MPGRAGHSAVVALALSSRRPAWVAGSGSVGGVSQGLEDPVILARLAIAAGLALNWSWLAAAGIAPILISVLPCLAMCALGLCMNRSGGKSCSTAASNSDAAEIEDAKPVTQAVALDASPDRAAPMSGDAALLASPEPQPSKEKRPTDA